MTATPPRRTKLVRDEPLQHQAAYVGRTARLDVPLKSVTALRRIAEELRGLATNLEYLSRQSNEDAGFLLLQARMAVHRAQKRLAEVRGRGRPVS